MNDTYTVHNEALPGYEGSSKSKGEYNVTMAMLLLYS